MKNRKHIFIPLFIFLGAALVSLIYSIIDYKVVNPTLASATANIQFNFDGASSGVDPDGNPFNPIGLLTDDVIESAAQKCELNYTADDVRPYLSMENIVPKNILKEISSYQKTLGTDEKEERHPKVEKEVVGNTVCPLEAEGMHVGINNQYHCETSQCINPLYSFCLVH